MYYNEIPRYPQYDEIEYYDNNFGRSPKSRKYYMESKEMHNDKNTKL